MLGKLWRKRGARTILLAMLLAGLGSVSVEAGGYISEGLEEPAQGGRQVLMYLEEEEAHIPSEFGRIYVNKDSRTMVPIRFISESLGHEVEWDRESKKVLIDKGDIEMTLNSREALVKGQAQTMDTELVLIGGRTYVPLRFISENLGYEILYGRNDYKDAIFIYKDTKPSEAILRAYINKVVNIDTWKLVKETGIVDNVKEGGRWKPILGKYTHRFPGYIIEDDGLGPDREFRIEKVSGKWPNEEMLPPPIFYVASSPNGIHVYMPSMDVYGTQVKRVMVKIHHRDEQKVYDQGYMGPMHEDVASGERDLLSLKPNKPFWDFLSVNSPNAIVYSRNGGVYSTIWTKDKKPIPWPKDNRFKTLVELKITDKNMKDHTVLYHMDFNMVQ